jgi:hypothetical protein
MVGKIFTQGFFGVLPPDAGDNNGDIRFVRRDFSKQRGFFLQREANE